MIQNNVKKIMQLQKITQKELSQKLKISIRLISLWWTQKKHPTAKRWEPLAQALSCDVKDLF